MFVISLSSSKLKRIFVCISCACVAAIFIVVVLFRCTSSEVQKPVYSVNNNASDINEILSFVSGFGWDVSSEPDEVREIIIPAEFDELYENYNAIQLSQGYDLRVYSGQRAKNWSFTIKNYPGYEGEECIKINILIKDGVVIGGDVCSVELGGFMHGFSKE